LPICENVLGCTIARFNLPSSRFQRQQGNWRTCFQCKASSTRTYELLPEDIVRYVKTAQKA